MVLGVRGHLRNHAEIVGVAICFAGFVHGPPATRFAVHFRIRAPVSTHTKPLSHPSFWSRNKLLICLRSTHQCREIILKNQYTELELVENWGIMGRKHTGIRGAAIFIPNWQRRKAAPLRLQFKNRRWFTKNVIGVASRGKKERKSWWMQACSPRSIVLISLLGRPGPFQQPSIHRPAR